MVSCSRWLVVLLTLGVAISATGCLQPCTEAGCTSGISVKVVGQPAGGPALVRACVGEMCAEVPWPTGASPCEEVRADWRLSVCVQDDGSMTRLAFPDDANTRDGLKFEFIIEDADGVALVDKSESVRFSDSYPNGKECPGHCKYANYRY